MSTQDADTFYRARIADEIASGEPELAILTDLVPKGGTAVDIGANQGLFAYALSGIADTVHAFEANPEFAAFARTMLADRAIVHGLALSNTKGSATFYVPLADDGAELHLAGNLKNTHTQFARQKTFETEVTTLDSFNLTGVTFIKVDVEGSELEVLEGAQTTIMRDRPGLLLELLSGTYDDPAAITRTICERYSYDAFVVQDGRKLDAFETIASLNSNTSWGTHIATRNVLFLPRA